MGDELKLLRRGFGLGKLCQERLGCESPPTTGQQAAHPSEHGAAVHDAPAGGENRVGTAPAALGKRRSSDSSVAVSESCPPPRTSMPRRSPSAPNMRHTGQRSATGGTIAGVNCVATASW